MKRTALLLTLILIAGAVLRLGIFCNSLEYDEIWTITHYSMKPVSVIFTDLSTPNNHPLNSLLVKLVLLWKDSEGAISLHLIRIFSFLAGMGAIFMTWLLGCAFFRSRAVGLGAAALVAFLPITVDYSVLARGYSLQLFLLILFAWFTLKASRIPWYFTGAVITGILSVLTLSTSVLFLVPVCAIEFFYAECRKKFRRMLPALCAYLVLGCSMLFWYLFNYAKFAHGQMFGEQITSLTDFLAFAAKMVTGTAGYPAVIILAGALLLCALDWRRKQFLALFAEILFPLLMALVLKAGAERIYIPLIPFIGIASAATVTAVCERRFIKWVPVVCMTLCAVPSWFVCNPYHKTDWTEYMENLYTLPENTYFVIPSCDSLAAFWNCMEKSPSVMTRLKKLSVNSTFLLAAQPKISGQNGYGFEQSLPVPMRPSYGSVCGKNTFSWQVIPLTENSLRYSGIILAKVETVTNVELAQITQYLSSVPGIKQVLIVNSWFSIFLTDPKTHKLSALLVIQTDRKTSAEKLFAAISRIKSLTGVFTLSSIRINQKEQK